MLKAAICDDERDFLDSFEREFSRCCKAVGADIGLTLYDNGEKLLCDIQSYDAVFLDIDMAQISGLEIAERINKSSPAKLIFVTAHDELVYSSFRFQPLRFIRKTHLSEELPEAVESLYRSLKMQAAKSCAAFDTADGTVTLGISEIIYIEIYDHWAQIHLNSGEPLIIRSSLSELERRLEPAGFIRIHRSYLVSGRYIRSVRKRTVELDNGQELPLSRYKAEKAARKFREYLRAGI